jgi:hypothetical protein
MTPTPIDPSDAERYDAAVAEAADAVAAALSATSVSPDTDAIFTAAGITPTTETRMAALTAGRRIYADRAELHRQELAGGEARTEAARRGAAASAAGDLDRVVKDPKAGLEAIFAVVIAHRRATGHPHPVGAITFEAAVEAAVQVRSWQP